jgi:hypothetical protein
MSDYVWVSDAVHDTMLKLFVETDVNATDRDRMSEAAHLNNNGQSVPVELCPKKIWADNDAPDYERMPRDNMPDLFFANRYWIVSERAAGVLRRFDLGGGALHPVTEGVCLEDQVTRVPGEFYTWIQGNIKTGFLPDETPNKSPFGIAGLRWNLPTKLNDEDIAVSTAAIAGPDVWRDTVLMHAVFLSQSLGDALVAAGLKKAFHLYKARVV